MKFYVERRANQRLTRAGISMIRSKTTTTK
jgi:hypothetical protein